MNIVVIASSPRQGSSSSTRLANEFANGAREAGHEVYVFDAGIEPPAPCKACGACKTTGSCVQFDPFALLASKLPQADLIAFATPIYYFTMCAQLKAVVDRLHMFDKDVLWGKRMVLITSSNSDMSVNEPVITTFERICNWFTWKKVGQINAVGVNSIEQLQETDFIEQARELGKSL